MKRNLLVIAFVLFFTKTHSQVASGPTVASYFLAKEFSKDIALYRAKDYAVKNVFGKTNSVIEFEMDPLAATSSGEVTSLVYNCKELKKEGLILGFFGSRWNDAGVIYQAYAFKDLPASKAIELMNKIESVIKDKSKYLENNANSNNIYFSYDDLTFVITINAYTEIRIFWEGFDASWDGTAFKRTKRRLLKKLD
ncbi:hypothetical protein SAMN05421827_1106 [Pedobacter terrae]|uniref:Uncharacterized protein n=1 Tax=Pedobacter terrae TaxID=405671 RepID=A0A1G7WJ27_9SPHI|nr:hypothetical protein [Pedobacter terrae]SDG71965.1 hypothetical protein SAMN05421827_1106 [Pedobacter terrae]